MKKIGLLSDTHGFLDEKVFRYFEDRDEIWHGGDFGSIEVVNSLNTFRPLRGVYGNIDGQEIRHDFKETARFHCENLEVFMTHIGGYPGKYAPTVKQAFQEKPFQLFIAGHSHILKVMYDDKLQCLHMNPGAAGKQGWHKVRTIIRFVIDGNNMKDCEVIELGKR